MSVSSVSNNPYMNNYYQSKTGKTGREAVQEDTKQEMQTDVVDAEKTETTDTGKTGTTQTSASDFQYPNSIMRDGLYVNVDPKGEIARKAWLEEFARQINESISKVKNYYAEAHKETMSHDDPYNHLLAKYNSKFNELFPSPYFRSDMSEEERDMAFHQELAMLNGNGVYNLSDPYAWASSGGVPDREKQLDDAVQAALDKRREEMLEEYGGETTREDHLKKTFADFMDRYDPAKAVKMGELNLKA